MVSVLINTNLLRQAVEHKVRRFFYASSACVYHADTQTADPNVCGFTELGLKESYAYFRGGAMPEDGYGWEKLFSERMCRHFREDYGLETRVARFHNIYGPYGSWQDGREKAPAAICRKIAEAKLIGRVTIDVWGDGTQQRSFCWIDDCIEGIIRLAESDHHEPINIGSDELVTINELIKIAQSVADYPVKRDYDRSKPQGVAGRNSDNTKIKEVLGCLLDFVKPMIGLRGSY
jgi:nucleoside-diphosphate-sugar epimerase